MQIYLIFIALAISNFLYQFFTEKDWDKAFNRTCFQGIGVFIFWLLSYL